MARDLLHDGHGAWYKYNATLDGGVAIYDEQLRSRFDWLREPDNRVLRVMLWERSVYRR
jgi:hypothetical protein